ncbi:MAG: hypothetical protein KGD64_05385 [Candidatus Heimdallarchaeota archaeon]|nr:hypothetical protein [Candidatus Heimdallarchaeota archaeon]
MVNHTNSDIQPIVKRLLEEAWQVKENEKILIISDYPTSEDFANQSTELIEKMIERNLLAKSFYEIIRDLIPNEAELYYMKPTFEHYKNPADELLKNKIHSSDIVFSLTEYSLTDTPIVTDPLNEKKLRHISAPLIPAEVFYPGGPCDVDFLHMEKLTTKVFNFLQRAKSIEISDISGSNLSIEFNKPMDWIYECGFCTESGMFSNLPAGEVTLELPYNQTDCVVSGKLNIFPGWQEDLTRPLKLTIQNSRLVDSTGGGKVGAYIAELILKEDVQVTQIGIGTNPKAMNPFSPTVADKVIGMAHVRFSPDERVEHYYIPISRMKIDGKTYQRNEIFE